MPIPVADNGDHYIMQNSDGSFFPLPKTALNYSPAPADVTSAPVPQAQVASIDPSLAPTAAPSDQVAAAPAPSTGAGATGGWEATPQNAPTNQISRNDLALTTVPGGSQGSTGMPDLVGRQAKMENAFTQQQTGVLGQAQAAQEGSAAQAKIFGNTNKALETINSQMENNRIETQKAMDAGRAQVDAAQQKVKETVIDPNKWYSNLSTGNKIAAAISIGLGALGGGITGQSNHALEIINGAINRDIDAQKQELEKNKGLVKDQESAFGLLRTQLGDNTTALLTKKALLLEQASNQVQQVTAQTNSKEAMQKGIQLSSQLEQQKQQTLSQIDNQLYQQHLFSKMVQENGGPTANMPTSFEEAKKTLVPGHGFASSPEQAKAAQEAQQKFNELTGIIGEMRSSMGRALPYTEQAEKAHALQAALKERLHEFSGITRMGPETVKLAEEQAPDVSSMRQGKAQTQLKTLEDMLYNQANAFYNSAGLKPIPKKPAYAQKN